MKTFDYEAAWHEIAKPAYEVLPQDVRDLVAYMAEVSGDLHQLPDGSMPWPEAEESSLCLRERFDHIPAEVLSFAAQAVYNVGHWYPGKSANGYPIPGRENGGTWKFSHYADQSLRARLGLPPRGNDGPFQVLEGVIRICYSSKRIWTWTEVQPATVEGLQRAKALRAQLSGVIASVGDRRRTNEIDNRVYAWFEALRTTPKNPDDWPSPYFLRLVDTTPYMVDESEIKARQIVSTDWEAAKRDVQARADEKIADANAETERLIWFLDHHCPVDNVIYYRHTGKIAIGWRHPLTRDAHLQWIERLGAECPYEYEYKYVAGYDPTRP